MKGLYALGALGTIGQIPAGMSRLGRTLHANPLRSATVQGAFLGAAGGGLHGATFGRDPGQSRLGGFVSGALGGAALGAAGMRYGHAAMASNRRLWNAAAGMSYGAGAKMMAVAAGRSAYRQMRRDAISSYRYIGSGITKAFNKIDSTLKG